MLNETLNQSQQIYNATEDVIVQMTNLANGLPTLMIIATIIIFIGMIIKSVSGWKNSLIDPEDDEIEVLEEEELKRKQTYFEYVREQLKIEKLMKR